MYRTAVDVFLMMVVLLRAAQYGLTRSPQQDMMSSANTAGDDEKQKNLLSKTMKNMLGLHDMEGRPPLDTAAPKYMQQLYEQYRTGGLGMGRQTANTVRSIRAEMGYIDDRYMFVFNLSVISKSEQVFNADLHIYRKKSKSEDSFGDVIMRLRQSARKLVKDVGAMHLHERGHGWHAFDVTPPVHGCLRDAESHTPDLFVVTFENESGEELPPEDFMQKLHRPFLVVFSNDTQEIDLDHIDPYMSPVALRENIVDPETGDLEVLLPKSRKSEKNRQSRRKSRLSYDLSTYRFRRSIHDNEIPEEPVDFPEPQPPFNVPKQNSDMLSVTRGDLVTTKATTSAPEMTQTDVESRLLPYPKSYRDTKRRRRKKKNREGRKRSERVLPLPKEWEKLAEQERRVVTSDGVARQCGRRRLVVDFADIGWSDWIISPKSFEANYCAGTCSFPLKKGSRPSNHATIQSLVNAIGLHEDVPAPCCVPDTMSSVTLLYFDQNWNAVLKNYPMMSVESCSCR